MECKRTCRMQIARRSTVGWESPFAFSLFDNAIRLRLPVGKPRGSSQSFRSKQDTRTGQSRPSRPWSSLHCDPHSLDEWCVQFCMRSLRKSNTGTTGTAIGDICIPSSERQHIGKLERLRKKALLISDPLSSAPKNDKSWSFLDQIVRGAAVRGWLLLLTYRHGLHGSVNWSGPKLSKTAGDSTSKKPDFHDKVETGSLIHKQTY